MNDLQNLCDDDDETEKRTPSCGVASAMTQTEIDEILKAHNDYRRKDGGDQFTLVSMNITSDRMVSHMTL